MGDTKNSETPRRRRSSSGEAEEAERADKRLILSSILRTIVVLID